MKGVAILLTIAGIIFIGIGGYQLFKTDHSQNKSLEEAKIRLADQKSETSSSLQSSHMLEPFLPDEGESVGILHIPRLNAELPIIEGTDPEELAKGVGHYAGTAYPLEKNQVVLSGHRDTVFRRMGELKLGDTLTVRMPYGDFTYQITDTEIVNADDRTVIKSTAPDEVLTLTTCYPFSYIGNAPDRYIITALPVINE
ncbi:class D sortase [Virgibacillus kekensis]|uniref:Class D sortase n=1 Tax=Virgibacillus kekensis TaxID=202261 RepID=A0ABV9DFF8_9BACI